MKAVITEWLYTVPQLTPAAFRVADGSSTSPHTRQASDTDESGRGLFVIALMADLWGTRYSPSGKTVWTERSGS
ncbi:MULTISPECIES: ATP-binding protein [unclassified Streptomyces]|uniref:ATP-binding protein n=1 Tax=unclassified Streptomyces TaxID=2593676 RepID=UPI002E7FBC40|nr:ATP-binding protein [Streptomyces sp. NBC_00569]WSE18419.1 ATP-binding protein [Streptomyces sp. NBC_01397]WUB92681.1 ATP-binding protein [Streptomyces sp. NBC_00569]